MTDPLPKLRRCEEIHSVLVRVIPAPYQVRGKLQPEFSIFGVLRTDWTPVFTPLEAGLKYSFFTASDGLHLNLNCCIDFK
jgi:hypothetical protein